MRHVNHCWMRWTGCSCWTHDVLSVSYSLLVSCREANRLRPTHRRPELRHTTDRSVLSCDPRRGRCGT